MTRRGKVPGYLLHEPSGNARCIIDGRQIWLGKYGTRKATRDIPAFRRDILHFFARVSRQLVRTASQHPHKGVN